MKTNRIQPADIIFVVDLQTEEIYEMTAREFARQYSDLLCDVRYNHDLCAFYVCIVNLKTGITNYSQMHSDRQDAIDDKFIRQFSAASYNPVVTWSKKRKQAETMIRLHMDNKLSEVLVR